MMNLRQFLASNAKYVAAAVIIIVVAVGAWFFLSNTEPTLGSYTVSRGNVVSSTDIPGTVSSSNSVDLSFQEMGQIASVYVKEGDTVTAGEALASLDDSAEQAQLAQQQAALTAAQAKLSELQAGTRPEQLAVYEQDYSNATAALIVAMNNVYLGAEDAVVNKIDMLFTNGDTANPTLNIPDPSQGIAGQYQVNNERVALGAALANWKSALGDVSASDTATSSLEDARKATADDMAIVESFLNHMSSIVGDLSTGNSGLTQAAINTDTSLANAASQEATGAADTETSADSAWKSAADALALAQAGSQSQDIEAQQAVVQQAQAAIASAQLAINHATITAPYAGIVRNVSAKNGLVVSANMPVLSIINNGILKFDAYAPETDVPNTRENATTTVTLDSYGDSVGFPAQTTAVDTSETVMNGSPSYHVTLYFTEPDSRILEGMTGDVHVVTAEHDNVVEVPFRLILEDGASQFVILQNSGMIARIPVTVGLTGDDGMVEVTSGLQAGQKISDF